MGMNQGFNLLSNGQRRRLTKSEVERGYLFISKDKRVRAELGDNYVIKFGDEVIEKKIDTHGRVVVGREALKKIRNKIITLAFCDDGIEVKWK